MEDCNTSVIKGLVSIIMPTHNRASILNETIDSIINQDYKNIELIVVNDHSTDNTKDIISEYIKEYDFIYYYESDKKGACAARNIGINASKGEYIQFIDDDDIVDNKFIQLRVEALNNNSEYGFATCNMKYFENNNINNIVKKFRIDNFKHDIYNHLLRSALPAPLFLLRRKVIEEIGYWDESCLRFQDVQYYNKLFLKEIKGIWLPDYLYYVRIHSNSISNKRDKNTILSILNVFDGIHNEWTKNGKMNKKLNRILLFLSISTVLNNKATNRLWAFKKISRMLLKDIDASSFFIIFSVKNILFKTKAIDSYL